MKIALIGHGKMGKLIEVIALSKKHEIVATATSKQDHLQHLIEPADVCIDFSIPSIALKTVETCAKMKKNLVMGTTGWYEHLPFVQKTVTEAGIGFLYAPNFSVGVNLFLKIVQEAAKLVENFPEYDIGMIEKHHNQKKDSPSGTALAIANALLAQITRKNSLVSDRLDRQVEPAELHIATLRCGQIPGSHTVLFDSPADTITLTHEARSRDGFASGAVFAAEWLEGKKGFYTLQDTL